MMKKADYQMSQCAADVAAAVAAAGVATHSQGNLQASHT